MISGKRVLGLIPARGGSKGIPRKNIRILGGKPLIAWTIDEAKKSKYIDELVVSTEDSEIADVAKQWGAHVPFIRPRELATDTARGTDVVLHAMEQIPYMDAVVLLQPTSPFRNVQDIDSAIKKCSVSRNPVVSVTEVQKSPYWMYKMKDGFLNPVLKKRIEAYNRQKLEPVYVLNGAIYIAHYYSLRSINGFISKNTQGYIMPIERSLDIDSEFDWDFALYILSRNG